MNLAVTIKHFDDSGEHKEVGKILWDGEQMTAQPPEDRVLQNILEAIILAPDRDGRVVPLTRAAGEKFLRGLQYQYRSPYLLASAPVEEREDKPFQMDDYINRTEQERVAKQQ